MIENISWQNALSRLKEGNNNFVEDRIDGVLDNYATREKNYCFDSLYKKLDFDVARAIEEEKILLKNGQPWKETDDVVHGWNWKQFMTKIHYTYKE